MDFFDKLGKKASEAYKVTADKTGKIAKETKLKFKINELKSKIDDIYEEIGKEVYQKHVREEEISIKGDLEEKCAQIDVMSDEIESLLKECLSLRDRKQCSNCYAEIDKDVKFCPECGAKQEEDEVKVVEVVGEEENTNQATDIKEENNNEEVNSEEHKENLEKTVVTEINPDTDNITDEEVKNAGADIEEDKRYDE